MILGAIWISWKEIRYHLDTQQMLALIAQYDTMSTPPVANPCPGINPKILDAVLNVAWGCNINADKGHRDDHILAVGPAEPLMEAGYCKGRDKAMWQGERCFVQTPEGASELRNSMNSGGAHIIDAITGQICAGQFFSANMAALDGESADASLAQTLSTLMGTVTFEISSDGSIREFRAGKLSKRHRENHTVFAPLSTVTCPRNDKQ